MKQFFAGIAAVIVVAVAAAFVVVWFALLPSGADVMPSGLETWAAHHSLKTTIANGAPPAPYPYGPANDATIAAGAKLYIANCAVCHGSGGSDESNVAKGQYVRVPQFTKHGVDDDPEGETYYIIEHGVRFTGMPAFKDNLTEQQIWQITYFLKRPVENLPPAAAAIWNQPHGD